ncbi:glycosyl transferase family 25 [Neorhizobium huautlense]|uniref:Glycosyl transferase family 25 n=2 Tax=Neorhizobium huautlense TaxID=67774 RepID=A0ABT9Q349_9HYPH|nr:glycosyl transferase family 25 [Neorhizobium huautlense]
MERRTLQAYQLQRLGLSFEFMDATTAGDIPDEEMKRLQRRWARRLRDTEVSCALSHRKAWGIVAKAPRPMLVIEDDVILSTDIATVLTAAATLSDVDCVNLETFGAPKTLGRPRALAQAGYTVAEVFRDSAGAAAYLLWPQGAQKLLTSLSMMLPLADAAINLAPNLRKLQIEPAAAIQVSILNKSEPISHPVRRSLIATSRKTKERPPLAEWLGYKIRRVRVSAIVLTQNIRSLGRSRRIIVDYADTNNALALLKEAFPELTNPPT